MTLRTALPWCLAISLLAACGGNEPPPKTADDSTTSGVTTTAPTATTTPDMPAPPAATTPAPTTDVAAAPPAPPAAVKVSALKLTATKGKKLGFSTIEVKDDGSILVDNKPAGKIANDQLQDASGATLFSVGQDGSVTSTNMTAKFSSSDELVADKGKITVGDDGTVTMTNDKGKADALAAKFDAVNAGSKREAALLIAAFATPKAPGMSKTSPPAMGAQMAPATTTGTMTPAMTTPKKK